MYQMQGLGYNVPTYRIKYTINVALHTLPLPLIHINVIRFDFDLTLLLFNQLKDLLSL